jgi:ribosomal protein S18 acetylase RimI-like enzyme
MSFASESFFIRTFEPHEWQAYRDVRLRSLAESPDAFGSTLEEEQARSDEAWTARLAAATVSERDYPLVAEQGGVMLGLLWAKVDAIDTEQVNIYQMWVGPESRGRGVAAALMSKAIAWARTKDARLVELDVTCGDSAAVRLYRRLGFRDAGVPQPLRAGAPSLAQTMRLVID